MILLNLALNELHTPLFETLNGFEKWILLVKYSFLIIVSLIQCKQAYGLGWYNTLTLKHPRSFLTEKRGCSHFRDEVYSSSDRKIDFKYSKQSPCKGEILTGKGEFQAFRTHLDILALGRMKTFVNQAESLGAYFLHFNIYFILF